MTLKSCSTFFLLVINEDIIFQDQMRCINSRHFNLHMYKKNISHIIHCLHTLLRKHSHIYKQKKKDPTNESEARLVEQKIKCTQIIYFFENKIKNQLFFLFSFSSPLEIHFALFKNSFNLFKLHNHLFIRLWIGNRKKNIMTWDDKRKKKVPIELRGE